MALHATGAADEALLVKLLNRFAELDKSVERMWPTRD